MGQSLSEVLWTKEGLALQKETNRLQKETNRLLRLMLEAQGVDPTPAPDVDKKPAGGQRKGLFSRS